MSIPQVILIVWMALALTHVLEKHGTPSPDYNFWKSLIAWGVFNVVLYYSEFWK